MPIKNKYEIKETNLSCVHPFVASSCHPDNGQEGSLKKLRSAKMTTGCLFAEMCFILLLSRMCTV